MRRRRGCSSSAVVWPSVVAGRGKNREPSMVAGGRKDRPRTGKPSMVAGEDRWGRGLGRSGNDETTMVMMAMVVMVMSGDTQTV